MKPYGSLLAAAVAALIMLQGFQCASSEFAGAKLQMQQKNFKEAKRLLEIEVQKNPSNEEAWYFLGIIRGDEGDYKGMNEGFNAALNLSKQHSTEIHAYRYNKWGQHLNAGVNHLEQATPESTVYFDRAIEEFQKAAAAWPDTSLTYRYIGYAYNNKGELDEALKAFKSAWDKGKDDEAAKRMARIYIHKGTQYKTKFESDNAEKLKVVKSLGSIRKNTRKSDVLSALGAPDNIKKGPRGSKKEDWVYGKYNLIITIDGDRVADRRSTRVYSPSIDSTQYRLAMQQFDNSVQWLMASREGGSNDPERLQMLLNAYVQSDRIAEAIREYDAAVKGDPENKTSRYILGVLYRSANNYAAAVEQFQKAYELDPTYSDALFDLGATYYNWGVDAMRAAEEKGQVTTEHKDKFKMALPYIEKVSEQKPDDPQVWETLGTIYAQLGQKDKATKAFEMADKVRGGK